MCRERFVLFLGIFFWKFAVANLRERQVISEFEFLKLIDEFYVSILAARYDPRKNERVSCRIRTRIEKYVTGNLVNVVSFWALDWIEYF